MMHSKATIERIRTLLRRGGVPKGDALEEMLDHYLSEIEAQTDYQTTPEKATQITLQKIEQANFSNFQSQKNNHLSLILAAILALFFAFYTYQHLFPSKTQKIVEKKAISAPDGWPLPTNITNITSKFGMRTHPISKSPKQHTGIDIRAKHGAAVLATGAATVQEVGYTETLGHYIILAHNDRFSSRYCHLSAIRVQQDEIVSKGSIIGKVGNTGRSLAPHLHYEILDEGAPVDPLEFAKP